MGPRKDVDPGSGRELEQGHHVHEHSIFPFYLYQSQMFLPIPDFSLLSRTSPLDFPIRGSCRILGLKQHSSQSSPFPCPFPISEVHLPQVHLQRTGHCLPAGLAGYLVSWTRDLMGGRFSVCLPLTISQREVILVHLSLLRSCEGG